MGLLFPTIVIVLISTTTASIGVSDTKPDITFILADDLGWYDTAVHNPKSPTPALKELASQGMVLDRMYVFRYCSPTRRSFLSGRFPTSITTVQPDGANLCSDFLPLAVSTLTEKLASVGYQAHYVGKGHLGYETMDHLPINRGFLSHVGYLGGAQAYSYGGGSENATHGSHDMWQDLNPGVDVVPQIYYSANFYAETASNIITAHDSSKGPLFLYFPIQNVHSPDTLPPAWEVDSFPQMWDHTYANMLHMLDMAVLNVTTALRKNNLWDNSLIIFSADNGGVGRDGNNHPLRGHKHDPWEGGTRATAFISGGFVPSSLRGTTSGAKFVHIADWYPTLCNLAGVSPKDPVSFNGTIHDIDGVDVWPLLTGKNLTHPRAITPTTEGGIIEVTDTNWWKLVVLGGQSNYYSEDNNQTEGTDPCLKGRQPDPPQPGRTDPIVNGCPVCNSTNPCLYDVLNDPSEQTNIIGDHPDIAARLAPLLEQFNQHYVSGHLSQDVLNSKYKQIPKERWGGYSGPCYERK